MQIPNIRPAFLARDQKPRIQIPILTLRPPNHLHDLPNRGIDLRIVHLGKQVTSPLDPLRDVGVPVHGGRTRPAGAVVVDGLVAEREALVPARVAELFELGFDGGAGYCRASGLEEGGPVEGGLGEEGLGVRHCGWE